MVWQPFAAMGPESDPKVLEPNPEALQGALQQHGRAGAMVVSNAAVRWRMGVSSGSDMPARALLPPKVRS